MSLPTLLATWFGAGLAPRAPGTWGSLAAAVMAWPIQFWLGWVGLLVAAVAVFGVGIWAAERDAARTGLKDDGRIVIDEVAGQWIALLPACADWRLFVLGFVAFRLFDILKPWPVSWADRHVSGGLGVMLDDVLAGIYAAIVVVAVAWSFSLCPFSTTT